MKLTIRQYTKSCRVLFNEKAHSFCLRKSPEAGYRARVVDLARLLKLKGTVENLDDGRVRINDRCAIEPQNIRAPEHDDCNL